MTNLGEIVAQIMGADREELIKIVGAVKLRQNQLTSNLTLSFNVGDRVEFDHGGREVYGTITKINRKTVSLMDSEDRQWKVSPHFLTRTD